MSTETEQARIELLQLLFPDEYPSEWNYDGNVQDYLTKLGTYKLEDLVKEPDRLKLETNSIQEQIQELAVTNYKTFIETAECSRELFKQFNTIENKLDILIDKIPKFEEECKIFAEKSSDINDLRKLTSLTLTKNAQLLEILELPQLMNSFINDGLYEDSLELASHVRKLYNKYPDIPIFKSIADDVDRAWLLMLHQLLAQLRQDLSLPKCLQIVGHLRRMEVFTESELRLKFLQTRDCWLQKCLQAIPKDDVGHHLTKTIEVTRVNLFNIITQYRAIFNDDEHSPLALMKNHNVNQNVIFFSWIKDKIAEFLLILEEDLKSVTSIETILEQCMYFGLSFSKVGCDFRSLMIPIFTTRISQNFSGAVSEALKNFETNIERFTLINKNHPSIPWKTKNEDPLQPPDSLLEFYPLADYLNSILIALNKLRLCAPIAIIDDVVSSLQSSLIFISKSLLVLYNQEQQAFTVNSKDAFTRLCMSFSDDLVPYLQKCVHVIFPPSQIAMKLGVNVQSLQQEHISFLDKNTIVEPIKHLLPAKIEPDVTRASVEGSNKNDEGASISNNVEAHSNENENLEDNN
ncbi:conserved oligomeric Golgi complex subunit 8 [Anoplophora glabripennis]|nr:conserved oligomeric Golgi complex subunit 8 [Anoplophora glabripennis]